MGIPGGTENERHIQDMQNAPGTAQTAEMQAQMKSECRAKAFPAMPDQEIRACALECAVRLAAGTVDGSDTGEQERAFWAQVREFEDYIRGGNE